MKDNKVVISGDNEFGCIRDEWCHDEDLHERINELEEFFIEDKMVDVVREVLKNTEVLMREVKKIQKELLINSRGNDGEVYRGKRIDIIDENGNETDWSRPT